MRHGDILSSTDAANGTRSAPPLAAEFAESMVWRVRSSAADHRPPPNLMQQDLLAQ